MRRRLSLVAMMLMAALLPACRVDDKGLNDAPDADVDLPVDLAAPIDLGPDLACGPCDSLATFVTLPGGRFTGTTAGDPAGASTAVSANEGSCGGSDAPEAIFKIELTTKSDLFATTHGTGFDTVLYLRRGCCGSEVACNDDADGRGTSVLSPRGLDPGTYYIYVDGASSSDAGDFTIDIYAAPAATNAAESCGNPTPIANGDRAGNTCGFQDDYSPLAGCTSAVAGSNGLDQVFYFVLDEATPVTFSTCANTCIDTVLYVRDVCSNGGSQQACDDDSCRATGSCQPAGNQVQSRLTATLAPGVHYLFLDTFSAAQVPCGDFTINAAGIP